MRKAPILLFPLLLAACGGQDTAAIVMRGEQWQAEIAEALPAGTDLEDAKRWFGSKGLAHWYVPAEQTLFAPANFEPEPKALLSSRLLRSYDIRCRFTETGKLLACTVAISEQRWTPPAP